MCDGATFRAENWTKRYEQMLMIELLVAHKHLVDWNVDGSIRVLAMVDVLFKKCGEIQEAVGRSSKT